MTLVRRHARVLWLVALIVALGAGLAIASSATSPAQALSLCNPDTTFELPVEPKTSTGAPRSAGTQTIDGWTVASARMSPMDAYGGAGYDWYTYGTTCMDIVTPAMTMIGNFLYTAFVSVPAVILGAITQFAFSTTIANALLPFLGETVSDLEGSVFRTWAPLVIAFVLIGALFTFARGRSQKGFGDLSWMVVVIMIVGALASPLGPQFLQKVNDTTRNITSCVMFAATAGCSAGSNANSMTVGMVDSLSFDTWAAGALGNVAHEPIPPKVSFGERKDPFMVNENRDVTVPRAIIPAQNPGAPTWAETLRWTQTYTWNEVHAMKHNDSLRCSVSTSQNMGYLSEGKPIPDTDSRTELCGFKWLLRGAMMSHLLDHHPDSYSSAAGNSPERLTVSLLSGVTVLPVIILLLVLGFMVLIYQLEILLLFVTSPVVALLAMKNKAVGRRWFEMALASLVKWISTGLVLGLVMMLVDWSGQIMGGLISNGDGISLILAVVSRGILVLLFVIVAFLMFFKIQKMLLSATNLEGAANNGTKGKAALGLAALVGAGAVAGAAGAGAGAGLGVRAKAALSGAATSGIGRGHAGTQIAMSRAHRAGGRTRDKWEARRGAPEPGTESHDEEPTIDEAVPGGGPETEEIPPPGDAPGGGSGGGGGAPGGGPRDGGGGAGDGGAPDTSHADPDGREGWRIVNGRRIPPLPAGMETREDAEDAWTDLMMQPDIQEALNLNPAEEKVVEAHTAKLTTAEDAERKASEALTAKTDEKITQALGQARAQIDQGMDPAKAELAAFESVLADPELRQLDEVLRARRVETADAQEALRQATPDKVSELVAAMNQTDPAQLQVELGLSDDTMEKVARYRGVAQRATYESMPLEDSRLPNETLARARAAAAARGDQPVPVGAPSGGGDLASEALRRVRQMQTTEQVFIQQQVSREGGLSEHAVRDAIREGLREGMRDQAATAPVTRPAPAPVQPAPAPAPGPAVRQAAPPPPPPPPAPKHDPLTQPRPPERRPRPSD